MRDIGTPRGPLEPDHGKVFSSLRNPLALVATHGDGPCLSASTQGFRDLLGIGHEHAGQPILPLLPADWRASVHTAVQACMSARRSKRVRGLLHTAETRTSGFELDVYRIVDDSPRDHLLFALHELDQTKLLTDPRVASLFPQLKTNNPAVVYENDLKYGRARFRDNGLIEQLGLADGSTFTYERLLSRIHPQDLPQVAKYEAARAVMKDDEIITGTARFMAVSGEWRLVNFRARVLRRDRSGAPRRMLGVMLDVTDHNAVTDALGETEAALARAAENERRRIGRELHDSTAQHLLAISFGLGRLERSAPKNQAVKLAASEIRDSIDAASREIRLFSLLLHPPELADAGLEVALQRFCMGFARKTGLRIDWTDEGPSAPVSEDFGIAFYRIAQEALMNVFRHAQATAVAVRLSWSPSMLSLAIEDDGPGLDSASPGGPPLHGVGIGAMRARKMRLGGTLTVDTSHGGLSITASAPLEADASSAVLIDIGAPSAPAIDAPD